MWFFPVWGFALEVKLHGVKCHKFYRPEGVLKIVAVVGVVSEG